MANRKGQQPNVVVADWRRIPHVADWRQHICYMGGCAADSRQLIVADAISEVRGGKRTCVLAAITNVAMTGVVRKGNAGQEEAGAIYIPELRCENKCSWNCGDSYETHHGEKKRTDKIQQMKN